MKLLSCWCAISSQSQSTSDWDFARKSKALNISATVVGFAASVEAMDKVLAPYMVTAFSDWLKSFVKPSNGFYNLMCYVPWLGVSFFLGVSSDLSCTKKLIIFKCLGKYEIWKIMLCSQDNYIIFVFLITLSTSYPVTPWWVLSNMVRHF